MVTVATVRRWLEKLAPRKWAQDWDNVGLMVGKLEQKVERIALALDPQPQVVAQAIEQGADLLLTHHPLIFKPLAQIELDRGVGEIVAQAIGGGLSIYSLHTNLDLAPCGMAEFMAQKLGLENISPACSRGREQLYKLVVFVPEKYNESVRAAMAAAGAGWIGNYSDTSFSSLGTGTFKPQEGTTPFIGEQGELAQVSEKRLETIVPEGSWPAVRDAMLRAHPYEEVAYDLYPLAEPRGRALAFARIGTLPQALPLANWAEQVAQILDAQVHYAGDSKGLVQRIAVIPGSGGSLWQGAASADCIVTGELGYHQLLEIKQAGKSAIVVGHEASEAYFPELILEFLQPRLQETGVEVIVLRGDSPWQGIVG